jgi:heptosyltransferase-2
MKILITYLTGIGNTILFIPTLRALRQWFADAVVDVVVRHQASKEILERINSTRNIYVFNPNSPKTFAQKVQFLHTLRQERYDVNITAVPANRMEFNVMSFLIGAKRRIAAGYQVGYYETLRFLQTELVEVSESYHDIDQNLSLLVPLGANKLLYAEKDISWDLNRDETASAEEVLRTMHLTPGDILIGFHPGCNPAQGNLLKRWPTSYFAMLGDKLVEQFGSKILLFGDQTETNLKEEILKTMKYQPVIPENMPLLKIAALIKRCQLFVTDDSGLMHVAAAVGIPTVSLFGPSDPRRNAPYGEKHIILKAALPCAPCNRYPHFQSGGSYVRCMYKGDRKGYCMQSITVEKVYHTIVQHYTNALKPKGEGNGSKENIV